MSAAIGEPLLLAPIFDQKPWGGRRLMGYGKSLPDGPIGESLESGAAACIVGGRFNDWTIGRLVERFPHELLGSRGITASGRFGDFPLLIKLIDANEDLSIQVHPDDGQAPADRRGKTEAWLILDAQPGASLITGIDGPLDIDRIEAQLLRRTVRPGDVYFVPAGTVHAIGGGVLLYEVQQASDVTYRLYDWGRPRETHVADALRVARAHGEARRIEPLRLDEQRDMLVACDFFALERWKVAGGWDAAVAAQTDTFRIMTVLDGTVAIGQRLFEMGMSVVLPADMPAAVVRGDGTILVAYVPHIERDVIAPLLAAGHHRAAIDALGIAGE